MDILDFYCSSVYILIVLRIVNRFVLLYYQCNAHLIVFMNTCTM